VCLQDRPFTVAIRTYASHGTGIQQGDTHVRAADAAGAGGLMIEVHPNPDRALSDGAQSLWPEQFEELVGQVDVIAHAIGRRLAAVAVRAEHAVAVS
jgi:3-deoxy-7-phosphoheptulonate synthase